MSDTAAVRLSDHIDLVRALLRLQAAATDEERETELGAVRMGRARLLASASES